MIYQLKITILHLEKPVWRRVVINGAATLYELHHLIQNVMGWTNSHLHEFSIGSDLYSIPDGESGIEMNDEREYTLEGVCPDETDTLIYIYDFGDDWAHQIRVESITAEAPGADVPWCLAGERACPPENCGGPPGYESILTILEDEGHPRYDAIWSNLPEEFDPEYFDLEEANNCIQDQVSQELDRITCNGYTLTLDDNGEEEW